MSTVAQIEAALLRLSANELARVEVVLRRLRSEGALETRFDGQRWPAASDEFEALVAELDRLPPLLGKEEADRLDAWRAAERERQKNLVANAPVGELFP